MYGTGAWYSVNSDTAPVPASRRAFYFHQNRNHREPQVLADFIPQIGGIRIADRVGARGEKYEVHRIGGFLHGVFNFKASART